MFWWIYTDYSQKPWWNAKVHIGSGRTWKYSNNMTEFAFCGDPLGITFPNKKRMEEVKDYSRFPHIFFTRVFSGKNAISYRAQFYEEPPLQLIYKHGFCKTCLKKMGAYGKKRGNEVLDIPRIETAALQRRDFVFDLETLKGAEN